MAVPYNVPAERQQEAFQFIRWLYDQDEFYVELNRLLGRIPGRPALWDAPELVEDSAFQMLAQQAVFTVYPGPLPSWYFGIGEEAWNKILFDGVAPSVAFQQAQVEANARWVEEPAEFLVENTYQAP